MKSSGVAGTLKQACCGNMIVTKKISSIFLTKHLRLFQSTGPSQHGQICNMCHITENWTEVHNI